MQRVYCLTRIWLDIASKNCVKTKVFFFKINSKFLTFIVNFSHPWKTHNKKSGNSARQTVLPSECIAVTEKKAKIHQRSIERLQIPKECRGREPLKKWKSPRTPCSLLPSLKDSTSSNGAHWLTRRPRSKKKFTAPKAEILQKNAETENLQKSAKTPQKAAPAKKAENLSFKNSTSFNEAHYNR